MSRHIAGVLLAGGLSRRMGGAEKSLIALAGRPLIQHAADRLAPQVGTLLVNANGDPARFAHLGLPVVADETSDFPGPLAGILAALHWMRRESPAARALLSVSADAPFLPPDLARRLDESLATRAEARAAVAQSRGRRHHVIALWRPESAPAIEAALARGDRKVETMVDHLGAISVPFADVAIGGESMDPFFNINTPEDLAFAEQALSRANALPRPPFVFGVAGWKNSGKTTLVERLVAELVRRGYRVSTIKHTHHAIAAETGAGTETTDSARHRRAGAREVALVSPRSWSIVADTASFRAIDGPEPSLADVLARLAPTDVVIVEGYKSAQIPKIEVRRQAQGPGHPLAGHVPGVRAVAADHPIESEGIPVLALDDIDGLVQVLLEAGHLPSRKEPS